MKFIIEVPERWIQSVSVEAESAEDAIEKIREGEGDYLEGDGNFEYSDNIGYPEDWAVYPVREGDSPLPCKRCGSPVVGDRCTDETCPFSDCSQNDMRGWEGHTGLESPR